MNQNNLRLFRNNQNNQNNLNPYSRFDRNENLENKHNIINNNIYNIILNPNAIPEKYKNNNDNNYINTSVSKNIQIDEHYQTSVSWNKKRNNDNINNKKLLKKKASQLLNIIPSKRNDCLYRNTMNFSEIKKCEDNKDEDYNNDNNDNGIQKEVKTGYGESVPETIIDTLFNSIVRIIIKNKVGTGFFMKFTINNKTMICLFTCHHVIEQQDIENERNIFIFYGKKLNEENRTIKLEKSKRFMKTYKKEDKDKYLFPDLNYKSGYIQYANKNLNYFMAGYPANRNERCISSGSIKSINYYYEFIHKLDTRPGSSGSPIVNDNCDVIGIHHSGYQKLKQNYGTFIGKVLDNLENEFFFPNNPNMIKYNDFYLPENRNIIPEINNSNNYIIGEIYINENQINQNINIINYGDNNKKEIEDNCLIKIDDINIQFSSTYTFTTCGIHKIKYKFKHTINSAKKLFFDCGSIIKLDFSNFKTQNINDMSQMFEGCISLKDLNLSNFNTKNVTNMAGMFRECKSLINLNLSHFDTKM